jgi:cytochrome P450
MHLTLQIISKTAFDLDAEEVKVIGRIGGDLSDHAEGLVGIPRALRGLPTPTKVQDFRAILELRRTIDRIVRQSRFGDGPRVCIGNHFAITEAVLVLATVVQRYKFLPVPGQTIRLQPAVTLRPKGGIRLGIQCRPPRVGHSARSSVPC